MGKGSAVSSPSGASPSPDCDEGLCFVTHKCSSKAEIELNSVLGCKKFSGFYIMFGTETHLLLICLYSFQYQGKPIRKGNHDFADKTAKV